MMNTSNRSVRLILAACFVLAPAWGQVFTMTREQLIKYTAKNPYARFEDGRPKVPMRFWKNSRICPPRRYPVAQRLP